MGRWAPSDCDWLQVAATILIREGLEEVAELVSELASRLANKLGEGDSSEPKDDLSEQGKSAAHDQVDDGGSP
jgi:hypothetical protein